MIDGSDNNDASTTISTTPVVPEAVQEIAVQTNPYNVEFGRNTGAQFNVITRSGTNALRGEVFEYYASSELNSRTNIEKGNGLDDPAGFTRHQVGGGIGGPIVRNRVFFFGLFQADIRREDGRPGTHGQHPDAGRLRGAADGAARRRPDAASRAAVLNALSFLRDVYAQNPVFSNVQTTLVNGVPIETGQVNLPSAGSRHLQHARPRRLDDDRERHAHRSLHLRPPDDAERRRATCSSAAASPPSRPPRTTTWR